MLGVCNCYYAAKLDAIEDKIGGNINRHAKFAAKPAQ